MSNETTASRSGIGGFLAVRNEWPLCAATITNLLVHHVERLWVLDHASDDDTPQGLRRMQELFGDRLIVRRLDGVANLQEAILSTMLTALSDEPLEWIFIVDADEFPMARTAPLSQLLARVPESVAAVAYQLDNWITPRSWSELTLDGLVSVTARAVTRPIVDFDGVAFVEQIESGSMNFFDVPFISKLIIRNRSTWWVTAGAHSLGDLVAPPIECLNPDDFVVAHLPLITRRRMMGRVRFAGELDQAELPSDYGWQSTVVRRMVDAGRGDEFWTRHSIGPDGSGPVHERSDEFAQWITPVIDWLRENKVGVAGTSLDGVDATPARALEAGVFVTATHRLQQSVHHQRRQLDAELTALRERTTALAGELERVEGERARLVEERAALLASHTWRWGQRLARVLGRRTAS